jgi:hypothetical protein
MVVGIIVLALMGIVFHCLQDSRFLAFTARPHHLGTRRSTKSQSMWSFIFSWQVVALVGPGLVLLGFGVLSMTPPEVKFAEACFAVGYLVILAKIAWWITFELTEPRWQRGVFIAVIFAAVGILWFCSTTFAIGKDKPPERMNAANAARESQITLFQSIDEFIAVKDENGLREQFDFPNILKYNLRLAKSRLDPERTSQLELHDIDQFFLGGKARLDVRYASVSNVNNRIQVNWLPGRIGVINTSAKYNENRQKLMELYSSAQIPAALAVALKELDGVIEKDSTMMIESLNESLSIDQRNITDSEQASSPFYGSAAGLYWTNFIPLEPKGDAIRLLLRDYINAR